MTQQLERLCSPAIWAEGPVWLPQQDAVVFSDVKGNQMFIWYRDGDIRIWRSPSHYANGNALDAQGRIVSCEHGRRCISRHESNGEIRVLVDRIDGKRFNSPNDVAIRSDGTIWFTDPPYGITGDEEGYKSESQVIGCYVYCFDPRDGLLSIAASDLQRPNGLAFSPDETHLYVADMSIVDFPTLGRRELRVYPVEGNQLGTGRHFAAVAPGFPDGFCLDRAGNLFCSCADGVLIFNPSGEQIGKIDVPERVSNCTLGGPNGDELYITATTSLYRIRLTLPL
ncbi:SMP-30/gluconolactonase/LRE family protein [Pectobacterium quasiaquaticum]|uniref:SMP-30/gluconolactonase/LRE family protein n=1 Tax=Pectobacterium quasiaquaticum TaxID=2774015 RepID=A0A9Q2EPJ3_9GAMM|nr:MULTISPECIES: SMP-30/gluconolactonase/LRE family protein [Pectobacterium]MBE5204035.1 SMP-30/gluconolactonase/LRE family protein [Pectobacterium quasiaquaticum]MBE5210508.1 SMP-30/gluconolactonase/LRE family protein [Pectobacterium quasiaquaticum]MBE5215002.1 SMP-30/gluconolactonase/LRE family protein [Pectobacterium quasiaquaticum]MBE5221783.1 SMP-30/gluconolactonase/LRE family protein [Pectobacterium quasiaquaticum]MBE5224430.1 SMP-30/gluconolactonase/LRE family protein [Pectobacterium qu